jgi:1,4-dihydroxy-2-naphthoate polyprenyltransferase
VIKKSTIQLLRFPFSFFLMPIYLFALSQTESINLLDAIVVFVILHLLVFPASNGYNSYVDADTESVGAIKNPLLPTKQLFWVTIFMDGMAIVLGCFISWYFVLLLVSFILASRAYSYRGIRLKKYPIIGYLTVVFFQGAVTFFMVMHGCSNDKTLQVPWLLMIAASLLIGGFYPLTQIYQHKQDKEDGVTTISMLLGYRGTFYFTAFVYSLAMIVLAIYFFAALQQQEFYILQFFMLPIFMYFFYWLNKVFKNNEQANFKNTMQMNIIASVFTNLAFITILMVKHFG